MRKNLADLMDSLADNLENTSFSRRNLLKGSLLGMGMLFLPRTARSQNGSGKYDVSYLWHPDLETILDYQEVVGKKLGQKVRGKLRVVKGRKNYGLIYDRDSSKETSRRVAKEHAQLLRRTGVSAVEIQDRGYDSLYNVSYGKGPNLEELKSKFDVVQAKLGPSLGKDLFIEKVGKEYALVYRRRGDRKSTFAASSRHKKLLEGTGIDAAIIEESNNPLVYGISSYLDEREEEKEADGTKEEKLPRPKPRKTPGVKAGNLEKNIEQYIARMRKHGRITADEKTAWKVYDLSREEELASINEDASMQAASMVKPFVALAYFHQVKNGHLKYGKKSKRHLGRMIQRSSNVSTNWVMQQVGGPQAVQEILQKHYQGIVPETAVVEYIPGGGRTYRNKASAHDYSRFLYALWNDTLPSSKEMRRLMALPGRDRIYTGARRVPAGTRVYNKTGSTARLCGDMGILVAKDKQGNKYPYLVVGIIEKEKRARNYAGWIASRGNVIREVSNMAYDAMKERHGWI